MHEHLCDSPLEADVSELRSSSIPENLRCSSPTRWREPLLSARSSTLCTVLFTVHTIQTHAYTSMQAWWSFLPMHHPDYIQHHFHTQLFPSVIQHRGWPSENQYKSHSRNPKRFS